MIVGKIIRGRGRGKKLGFPTANLEVVRGAISETGIYATILTLDGKDYDSVASVGFNPTFEGAGPTDSPAIEVHILDFEGDIYSKTVSLRFVARLRDEAAFPNERALCAQIERDIEQVRKILVK